jgi:hypothetical protein
MPRCSFLNGYSGWLRLEPQTGTPEHHYWRPSSDRTRHTGVRGLMPRRQWRPIVEMQSNRRMAGDRLSSNGQMHLRQFTNTPQFLSMARCGGQITVAICMQKDCYVGAVRHCHDERLQPAFKMRKKYYLTVCERYAYLA